MITQYGMYKTRDGYYGILLGEKLIGYAKRMDFLKSRWEARGMGWLFTMSSFDTRRDAILCLIDNYLARGGRNAKGKR